VRLLWGGEEHAARFAAQNGFADRDFGPCQVLWGLVDKPVGCVVLHDWNPNAETIEISALSKDKRFPNRAATRAVCNYAFRFCQCVYVRTDARNLVVRRWGRSIGASEHILPRLRGRGASEAFLILTKEAWQLSRWMEKS